MTEDKASKFFSNLKKIWHPINIYNSLKKLYFSIIPKGSKVYDLTYGFLRIFLKQLHLFNIYYQEWIRRYDTLTDETKLEVYSQINAMEKKPCLSVIMPVYNPPEDLLHQAIRSVINQIYPYWELCIADDASTNPKIKEIIQIYTHKDNRIRAVFRENNGHISAASNSALALATGEFIVLLDHDDILHPLALYYVAQKITRHPDSVIIYSDEDKITKKGRRLDVYFKPDFNYELFLSQNMVSHLGVYRTKTVREVGGFRVGLEGSQDYDLALRVLDQCKPEQIHHIPRPLYHWRIIKQSAAQDMSIKPYAIESASRAICDHLARRSVKAEVQFLPDLAGYQVSYALPDPPPSITIIIPATELSRTLIDQVETICARTNYPDFSILLGLTRKTEEDEKAIPKELLEKVKFHYYSESENISYPKKINQCVLNSRSDFVCLLDESVTGFDESKWLRALVSQAAQPGVGAVGPRMINLKNRVYSSGIILTPIQTLHHLSKGEEQEINGYFGWAKLTRGFSALSSKCLIFKTECFRDAGGINEDLHSSLYGGVDFCLSLKDLGYRNILYPSIELYISEDPIYNRESEIFDKWLEADRRMFNNRWQKYILKDPAFNPNLTVIDEGKILVNLTPDLDFPGD